VKAQFGTKKPGDVTGDEVCREIAKRWAKHQGRRFDVPLPASTPGGIGSTAISPPPDTRSASPLKMKGIKTPEEVREPNDDRGAKKR
jgi:hypothetical protein